MKVLLTLLIFILSSALAKAETYVLCVGIGKYANPKVKALQKTENDAKAMAYFFKKGTPNVITLTGKYATKTQILKSIKSQFSNASNNDRIIFYFSGHGYPGGFCPYDMMKREDGVSYQELIDIMNKSNASEKYIFADACRSGAIRNNNQIATSDNDNLLFFLASRGSEDSLESSFLANGFFTKYLLRGLGGAADTNRDKKITASEIFQYVSENVKSHTHERQHPVMWGKFDDNTVIVEYKITK